ncbi:AMP-binding protein [Halioglobus maricola]|uniref:AMP-binding protein n=1 Tax=Halioglobus maricola TaxID=2601894 RepID=A0A5P9NEU6_9GAMM|nr:AMP-binding protein [Halioglobus maricola]QFU74263.1 AMP-binding protein [Halioglobus maricola]
MSEAPKSPLEMFYHWEQETPDKVYLRQPSNLAWSEYTWSEVADRVRRVATFLKSKGYPEGSRIGIWSSNSMDWPIVDLAIMLSGHISVPIYPGQDIASANYILNHSEVRLVFCGDFDMHARAAEALPEGVETVAMLGCKIDTGTSLDAIYGDYEAYAESPVPNGDDVFTIIYTSGTTGNPKGVMHMFKTPGHVVPGLVNKFELADGSNEFFSFLPMSHAAERIVVEMCSLYANASISFSEGLETFGDEIRSVQPTLFFAVPRLWVKFKAGIDAKIPPEAQAGLNEEQKAGIAQALGLSRARFILTGSAPCPVDVQDWFLSMGIALRDGYGMTENFIHGCAWSKDDQPISGCVGQPMDDSVKVRLSDTGEIQFKSLGLMKGYYLNDEKTAEVFDDGWYCTGDSGKFDEDGNLWVTGRVSEVFKTSKGKFIVPMKLESLFGRNPNLAQFCCMGHGLNQPIVLVTLSELGLAKDRDVVKAELEALLDEINGEVPPYERISNIFVCDEWTIENALLTPTMKLKRKQIEDEYKALVQEHMDAGAVSFLG